MKLNPFFSRGLAIALYLISVQGFGQLNVTWPIEGSVIQRSGAGDVSSGTASIVVAGEIYKTKYLCSSCDQEYRFVKLNPENGAVIDNTESWQNLTITNVGGELYRFNNTRTLVPAGWYSLEIRVRKGLFKKTILKPTSFTKFGIGDVYIISGQSNSKGFEPHWEDNQLIDYDNTPNLILPDAVRVINRASSLQPESISGKRRIGITINSGPNETYTLENGIDKMGGLPMKLKYTKLELNSKGENELRYKVTGVEIINNPIFPRGVASWCWAPLGKKLIENGPKVPVLFFSTGVDNTSVTQWKNPTGNEFLGLKNTLDLFGSLHGVRTILWHQGERDNENNTSASVYKADLETVITNSRNINPAFLNLKWHISKASYHGNFSGADPNIIDGQTQVIGATSNKINIGSTTDGITNRGPWNNLHFTGSAHSQVAQSWFDNGNANKIWQNSDPILPAQPVSLKTATFNGSTYTLTAPDGYTDYKWVYDDRGLFTSQNNNQVLAFDDAGYKGKTWICYMRSGGRIYCTIPFYIFTGSETGLGLVPEKNGVNLSLSNLDIPNNAGSESFNEAV